MSNKLITSVEAVAAYHEGKVVEWRAGEHTNWKRMSPTCCPNFLTTSDSTFYQFRLASISSHSTAPWTRLEEVQLGAWFKHKNNWVAQRVNAVHIGTNLDPIVLFDSNSTWTSLEELYENYEYSFDLVNWQTCGG